MWEKKTVSAWGVAVDRFNCVVPSPNPQINSPRKQVQGWPLGLFWATATAWLDLVLFSNLLFHRGCDLRQAVWKISPWTGWWNPKIQMKNKRRDEPGSMSRLQEGKEMYVAIFCLYFTALQDIKLWHTELCAVQHKKQGSARTANQALCSENNTGSLAKNGIKTVNSINFSVVRTVTADEVPIGREEMTRQFQSICGGKELTWTQTTAKVWFLNLLWVMVCTLHW